MQRRRELSGHRALRRRALYSHEARRYFAEALSVVEEAEGQVADVLEQSLAEQAKELAALLDSPEMEEVETLAEELEEEHKTESRRSRLSRLRNYARGRRYYSEDADTDFDPKLLELLAEKVEQKRKNVPIWARPIVSKIDKLVATIKAYLMRPSILGAAALSGVVTLVSGLLAGVGFWSYMNAPQLFMDIVGGPSSILFFLVSAGIAIVSSAVGGFVSGLKKDIEKAESIIEKFANGEKISQEEFAYVRDLAPKLSAQIKELLKKKLLG